MKGRDERNELNFNLVLGVNSEHNERVLMKFITKLFFEGLPDIVFDNRKPSWISSKIHNILESLNQYKNSNDFYEDVRKKYGISIGDILFEVYDYGDFLIDFIIEIITGIDFFPNETGNDSIKIKYNEFNLFVDDFFSDEFMYLYDKNYLAYKEINEEILNGPGPKYRVIIPNTNEEYPDFKKTQFFKLVEKIQNMSINDDYLSSVLENNHKKFINSILDDLKRITDF